MFRYHALDLAKILIGLIIFVLSAGGLIGYTFNFRKKKFKHSLPMFIYALVVIIAFTLIYLQHIFNEYAVNGLSVRNIDRIYSYLNIFSAIVCFINNLLLTNESVKFLNTVPLFRTLQYLDLNEAVIRSSIWIIAMKVIAFPMCLEVTLILRHKRNEPERHLLWTLHTLLPWIIANIIPNCFFGALVANKEMIFVLNERLQLIAKEVNCLQTKTQMELQKPYYRMQRFCSLSDTLNILAMKYSSIQKNTTYYLSLLAAPFLCGLLCNLFGITANLFAHYHAIADTLINDEPYDTFDAITNSVFLIISIAEIGLQAHMSNESLMVSKQTGHLLQRMNLLHADVRFKESVEAFSLLVLVEKYKIQPWGMLDIDVSLLHNMLSAVTSFLLILIQSDLALRFSLK